LFVQALFERKLALIKQEQWLGLRFKVTSFAKNVTTSRKTMHVLAACGNERQHEHTK